MSSPSGRDFSHLVAPHNVLTLIYSILAMAMSNLVVDLFTLVLFIVLVVVYSFWWRFVYFGGKPRFGGGFCHFGGSLIGSRLSHLSKSARLRRQYMPMYSIAVDGHTSKV